VEKVTHPDAIKLVVDAIAAIRDREIDAGEGALLARATSDLLRKMVPQCSGYRWGWVWKATIYGASGTLEEVAVHLDKLNDSSNG